MAKRRPSGNGMVRKRDDGRWEGRIVVGHKDNGDSIFRYISAPTQKGLSAKLRQLTEAYKGVDLTEESNMSLSVWLDKWLDEYMAATLRPLTLKGYRRSLELHVKPHLGNKALSKITAADLRSLYRTLQETGRVCPRDGQSPGLSARTVHGIHTTLHRALKTAMEQNLIPSNPAAEVDPPKVDGAPMTILTEAQLDTFMSVIGKDEFWHDFFYTAVTTGLRRGEICALRWEDFDAKQGTLHVRRTLHKGKGKPLTTDDTKTYAGTRKIVLPPSTAQLLRERKKTALAEWIFSNPFDPEQPISPSTAYSRLKALLKETGLPDIRFHDIRHTFATASLEHGMDIKTLSTIIGHVSTATTLNVYAHVTDEMRKTAAAKIDRGIAKSETTQDMDTVPRKPTPSTFQPYKGQRRKPGTGCISQINENLREGRYSPRLPNGGRLARNVYAHSKEECEQKLANLIVQMKAEIAAQQQ